MTRPVALTAALLVALPAFSADNTVASFNWRCDFGADAIHTGYGLSLGFRGGEHFAPLSRLVEFKLDESAALATVAGLPLFANSYQANQSTADQAYDAGVDTRPWYSKQWVYWTLGGVAATAALLGTAGSSESENHTLQVQDNGSATPINGDLEGGYTVCASNAVPETCATVPPPGGGG